MKVTITKGYGGGAYVMVQGKVAGRYALRGSDVASLKDVKAKVEDLIKELTPERPQPTLL